MNDGGGGGGGKNFLSSIDVGPMLGNNPVRKIANNKYSCLRSLSKEFGCSGVLAAVHFTLPRAAMHEKTIYHRLPTQATEFRLTLNFK